MYRKSIDVGQGDSSLIQVNNKNILIDAGPYESKDYLINYLKNLNIKTLDYVIATHPHEDHIGSMNSIIKTFNINNFLAPKVYHNTESFLSMVNELNKKSLKINIIKKGTDDFIDLGNNTKVYVFSPIKDTYDNLNNYSPIIKIVYGNTSFLFTGDAEEDLEKEVLITNSNLSSNVLKIAHHGSSTSTTENFLSAVSPNISVISVGINNSYKHPSIKTLNLLEKYNIKYYRTDEDGTIIIKSDGNNLYVE